MDGTAREGHVVKHFGALPTTKRSLRAHKKQREILAQRLQPLEQ